MSDGHTPTAERNEWERLFYDNQSRSAATEMTPAPVVTREDVEKVINVGVRGTTDGDLIDPDAELPAGECVRLAIDAVWALMSGDDPAVFVVRESDISAVEVKRHDDGGWQATSPTLISGYGRQVSVEMDVDRYGSELLNALAVARAIEAEQALLDQVEEQADSLADILYGDELVTDQMRGVLERVVCAGMKLPEDDR